MSKKVKCAACGADNELTAVFCRSCGEKMALHAVQADHCEHRGTFSKEGLLKLLRLLVPVVLVAILGLALWPSSTVGAKGTREAARVAGQKMGRLVDAAKNGLQTEVEVTEEELNSSFIRYLGMQRARQSDAKDGKSAVQSISADLGPSQVKVVVKGKLFGKVPISYGVKGTPVVGEGPFTFKVKSGSVGHLPMPWLAAAHPAKRVNIVLSGMRNEKRVLDVAAAGTFTDNGFSLYLEER